MGGLASTVQHMSDPCAHWKSRRGRFEHHRHASRDAVAAGVVGDKLSGKWLARMIIDGKQHVLGMYDKEEDAARAYRHAAEVRAHPHRFPLLASCPPHLALVSLCQRIHAVLSLIKASLASVTSAPPLSVAPPFTSAPPLSVAPPLTSVPPLSVAPPLTFAVLPPPRPFLENGGGAAHPPVETPLVAAQAKAQERCAVGTPLDYFDDDVGLGWRPADGWHDAAERMCHKLYLARTAACMRHGLLFGRVCGPLAGLAALAAQAQAGVTAQAEPRAAGGDAMAPSPVPTVPSVVADGAALVAYGGNEGKALP
jgi:hypothetical protein